MLAATELFPQTAHIAAMVDPQSEFTEAFVNPVKAGAVTLGLQVEVFHTSTDSEIETSFAQIAQRPGTALLLGPDAFGTRPAHPNRRLYGALRTPSMYVIHEYAADGGLISYGPDTPMPITRPASIRVVLKGEKPAEMPVEQPTKFQLVINLKTAKALNLVVPDKLLALADEVIE